MENFGTSLIQLGDTAVNGFWLPVLFWTAFTLVITGVVWRLPNMHAYTRFYLFEGLLIALPAGIIAAFFINPAGWFGGNTGTEVFFSLPLEVLAFEPGPAAGQDVPIWSHPLLYAGLLTLAAIAFALLRLIRLGFSYYNLLNLRTHLQPVTDAGILSGMESLRSRYLHGRHVRLLTSDRINVPVTFGAFNPVIVIPGNTDRADLDMILIHELMHIRRGDYLWMWAEQVIRSLFAFHPLVHRIARRLENCREICCDAEVLNETDLSTSDYAMALVRYIQPDHGLDLAAGMAKPSNIKERITVMNQHRTTSLHRKRLTGIILGLFVLGSTGLLMACTDNVKSLNEEPATEETIREFQSMSTADLEEHFNDLRAELSDFLRENSGKNIESPADDSQSNSKIGGLMTRINAVMVELRDRDDLSPDFRVTLPPNPASMPADDPDVFTAVEKMPELVGGQMALYDVLRYPEMARRAGIEGRVIVEFIVDEQGSVLNPRILRGIGGGADEAAAEAISKVSFTPGMQQGKPVKVKMVQPIVFRLPADDSN